jgi:predicted TIM-barrel fold metal-dependent hydrolase
MIIDVNVNLSRWPFRRVPCDEPERLVAALRRGGVTQAWTGTLDGLFHRDVAAANSRLAEQCRRYGPDFLVPFGCVNPLLPDWQEDLRRCRKEHRMPGIRLHPNYHGYQLGEPVFAAVLGEAAREGLIVQVVLRMVDIRVQHRLMQVPDVDLTPLPNALAVPQRPPVVVLNAKRSPDGGLLQKLAALPDVYFDCAMWEGVEGVAALIALVSADRVLFGSHLPLFPLESSLLKLRESDLAATRSEAIRFRNASRLLCPSR